MKKRTIRSVCLLSALLLTAPVLSCAQPDTPPEPDPAASVGTLTDTLPETLSDTEPVTEPETEAETEPVPVVFTDGYAADILEEGISPGVAALLGCCQYYADQLQAGIAKGQKWVYSNSSKYVPQATSFDNMVAGGGYGANCALISNWALIDIGAMPEGARFYGSVSGDFANRDKVMRYLKGVLEVIDLRGQNAVFSRMFRKGEIKAGDIFLCDGHTFVYGGNKMFYACGHDAEWHSDPSAPTEDPSHAVFEKWDVPMQGNSNYSHSINFILRIRDDYVPRYYRNRDGELVRNPDKNKIS